MADATHFPSPTATFFNYYKNYVVTRTTDDGWPVLVASIYRARECDARCRRRRRCYCASSPASAVLDFRVVGWAAARVQSYRRKRGWAAIDGWCGEWPPARSSAAGVVEGGGGV